MHFAYLGKRGIFFFSSPLQLSVIYVILTSTVLKLSAESTACKNSAPTASVADLILDGQIQNLHVNPIDSDSVGIITTASNPDLLSLIYYLPPTILETKSKRSGWKQHGAMIKDLWEFWWINLLPLFQTHNDLTWETLEMHILITHRICYSSINTFYKGGKEGALIVSAVMFTVLSS